MARPERRSRRTDVGGLFSPVTVARASSSIADQIRTAIVTGQLKEGSRLPPERELAEQFGVSRVTVRDALRALEAMHPIRTREGARAHQLSVEEHDRILDALERHDGAAARREMAHHLLRGTGLEKRESALLALWDAGDQSSKRRR